MYIVTFFSTAQVTLMRTFLAADSDPTKIADPDPSTVKATKIIEILHIFCFEILL